MERFICVFGSKLGIKHSRRWVFCDFSSQHSAVTWTQTSQSEPGRPLGHRQTLRTSFYFGSELVLQSDGMCVPIRLGSSLRGQGGRQRGLSGTSQIEKSFREAHLIKEMAPAKTTRRGLLTNSGEALVRLRAFGQQSWQAVRGPFTSPLSLDKNAIVANERRVIAAVLPSRTSSGCSGQGKIALRGLGRHILCLVNYEARDDEGHRSTVLGPGVNYCENQLISTPAFFISTPVSGMSQGVQNSTVLGKPFFCSSSHYRSKKYLTKPSSVFWPFYIYSAVDSSK